MPPITPSPPADLHLGGGGLARGRERYRRLLARTTVGLSQVSASVGRVCRHFRRHHDVAGPPTSLLVEPDRILNHTFDSDLSGWSAVGGATLARATSGTHAGAGALTLTTNAAGAGVSASATGTYTSGHTYTAILWVSPDAAGRAATLTLGAGSDLATQAVTLLAGWQALTVNWTPASTVTGPP